MRRWAIRSNCGEHRARCFPGIPQLLAAFLLASFADGVEDIVVIRNRTVVVLFCFVLLSDSEASVVRRDKEKDEEKKETWWQAYEEHRENYKRKVKYLKNFAKRWIKVIIMK